MEEVTTSSEEEKAPAIEDQGDLLPKDDPTRQTAERTATPFDMSQLLLKGYCEQEFSINDSLRLRMRSIRSGTYQFLLQTFQKEVNEDMSAMLFDEVLRNYYLAGSLIAVNGTPIGPDLDDVLDDPAKSKEEAENVIKERLAAIKRLPVQLVGLIYAHFLLFNDRFDKALKGGKEELGNS